MKLSGNQQSIPGTPRSDLPALSKYYLAAAGFNDEISVSSPDSPQYLFPEWAAFLVWLGWYVRHNSGAARIASFVVLPSRQTACLFVGLGAQLAGAQLSVGQLDWGTLAQLPQGTEIFMQTARSRNKSGGTQMRGVIAGTREIDGQQFVMLKQDSCMSSISVSYAKDYIFTLKRTGLRAKVALNGHNELYCRLVPDFDRRWLLAPSSEGVIIGDLGSVKSAAQNVRVGIHESANRFPLAEILGLKTREDQLSKINAISDRYDDEVGESPVCFFNGRQALRGLEHFMNVSGAQSFIAILERAEYDEQVDQMARQLRGTADMKRLPTIPQNLLALPAGVECMTFPMPV